MMEEPEENWLDQSLRNKFEDFDLTPSAPVWAGIEQRLTPAPQLRPRRRRWVPLPLLLALVGLVGGALGWLLPRPYSPTTTPPAAETSFVGASRPAGSPQLAGTAPKTQAPVAVPGRRNESAARPAVSAAPPRQAAPGLSARPRLAGGGRLQASAVAVVGRAQRTTRYSSELVSPLTAAGHVDLQSGARVADAAQVAPATVAAGQEPTVAQAADSVPAVLRTLVALERQSMTQLPSIGTLAPGAAPVSQAGSRAELIRTLRAQRSELLRLQRRTDSTLLVLGAVLPAAPPVVAATPDTAQRRPRLPQLPARRWSLLLSTAPEQNTLSLRSRAGDTLNAMRRTHETGRGGFNASLLAEYQLKPRLSVAAGLGYSTYGANLRITNKNTEVRVSYDTTTTHVTTAYTSTHHTYSIRIIQIPQLSPVFNGSGQVIRYDTVYVPRQDTVRTTTLQHDTVRTTTNTITPLISKHDVFSAKVLKPTYRFFTVPVLVRYRLTLGPGRWWADVATGAQLQFFLGGTQAVTADGQYFHSERITVRNGPFRALNLALSGSLALNYALTERLSLSVAPSLRWQTLSVYKAETGLIQQPVATGLQVGLRVKL